VDSYFEIRGLLIDQRALLCVYDVLHFPVVVLSRGDVCLCIWINRVAMGQSRFKLGVFN
jgi:hypothetical protein